MAKSFKLTAPPLDKGAKGTNVLNLSKHFCPTATHLQILNKGLSFIPTQDQPNHKSPSVFEEVRKYHRRLKLAAFFDEDEDSDSTSPPFTPKSNWEPKNNQIPKEIRLLIKQDRRIIKNIPILPASKPNITQEETLALQQLGKNDRIIIKPADKGSVIVIQDREQYIKEATRQLDMPQYYRKLDSPINEQTAQEIDLILEKILQLGYITRAQRSYLQGERPPKARSIYFLPKIHKDPSSWPTPFEIPAGRPIVSDCDSETYQISEYLDSFLNPMSSLHPSYIKDTYDFVTKVRAAKVGPDDFIFSMDVDSLYTNIEAGPGLTAVRNCFAKNPDAKRPDTFVLELLKLALVRNDFEFNGQTYLQIKGVAMGKKFAPALADIYMAEWEETALAKCPLKPSYYFRYLDDIWGIWPHSKTQFEEFVQILNDECPSISLKSVLDLSSMDFLDTTTFKGENFASTGTLDTKVFFKATDTHALLHRTSFHPQHTFKGLVKSQLIRFHRICTRREDFEEATKTLFGVLGGGSRKPSSSRGYSRRNLRQAKNTFLETRPPLTGRILPLVTTFNNRATHANRAMKDNFNRMVSETSTLDQYRVISAYKKNANLQDLLVRSKLKTLGQKRTPHPHRRRGTAVNHHGTSCRTSEADPFQRSNCIYLIQCHQCGQKYVGETQNALRTRLAQHRYNITNHKNTETPLVAHFLQHGLKNLTITILDGKESWTARQRKRQEWIWIHRLKTYTPFGLNVRTDHTV